MIVSSLHAWPAQQAAFHPVIRQALAFIASQDFQHFAPGKIDLIPGETLLPVAGDGQHAFCAGAS